MFITGSRICSIYDPESIMQIVNVDQTDNIPVYEAKYINDGSLSAGSVFIFGSQIDNYEEVENISEDFRNMDSAIASFFSSIYK